VIVGVSGDDLDIPGYLEAHDPETGARQWRWWVLSRAGHARKRRRGRASKR
jgi:alcohol dehydrogenase (cytochrome c)